MFDAMSDGDRPNKTLLKAKYEKS